MAKTTTAPHWTWQDDYRSALAGKSIADLAALEAFYSNKRAATEREMECALMAREEIARRERAMGKAL